MVKSDIHALFTIFNGSLVAFSKSSKQNLTMHYIWERVRGFDSFESLRDKII